MAGLGAGSGLLAVVACVHSDVDLVAGTSFIAVTMFQPLPGFRDFYPQDCAIRNHLFRQWRTVAIRHGFSEFDAPVLEPLELFTAKSGPEIVSQLFNFEDKGGRAVTLRPELTPSLARMAGVKAGSLKRPVKWFSIGENFRYEKQQKGRLRSFYQFNADILGETSWSADAEVIALLIATLQQLGLDASLFTIRLSDRDLWLNLLGGLGLSAEQSGKALGIIDKLERMERDAILTQLANDVGIPDPEHFLSAIDTFRKLASIDAIDDWFRSIKVDASQRLGDWSNLLNRLGALGLSEFIQIDLTIVRGLAYYTGFVFEAFQTVGRGRAIAGGGRYDDLIAKLGYQHMPAVGFGMGDVVLRDLLAETSRLPNLIEKPDVYCVAGDEDSLNSMLNLVTTMRSLGLCVDYPLKINSFSKQLKAANQSGAPLCLIMGELERTRGQIKLRDMSSGEETTLALQAVIDSVFNALRGDEK